MKLELGVEIDIQRSDGRVHPAVISGIDGLNVTVEWFEYGETKGKEINLDQVYSLNPELQPKAAAPKPAVTKRQSAIPHHPTPVNNVQDGHKKISSPAPRSRSLRSKSMAPPNVVPTKSTKVAAPEKVEKSEVTVSHNETIQYQNNQNKQPAGEKENNKPSVKSSRRLSQEVPNNIDPARDRRSNCVKEVERLKKNREDRRARQTEIKKEQIKEQAELDPGNPNWHFLKMIREFEESLGEQESMSMNDPIVDHQICVCVRKRPINKKGSFYVLNISSIIKTESIFIAKDALSVITNALSITAVPLDNDSVNLKAFI